MPRAAATVPGGQRTSGRFHFTSSAFRSTAREGVGPDRAESGEAGRGRREPAGPVRDGVLGLRMSDVLDQKDIDALLQAVSSGDIDESPQQAMIFSRTRRDLDHVEIKEYDFKRPERISKDQMRALQTLHDTFARSFGVSLSGFLRTIVEVHVAHVEQMTYSPSSSAGLPNPTSFSLIHAPELDGTALPRRCRRSSSTRSSTACSAGRIMTFSSRNGRRPSSRRGSSRPSSSGPWSASDGGVGGRPPAPVRARRDGVEPPHHADRAAERGGRRGRASRSRWRIGPGTMSMCHAVQRHRAVHRASEQAELAAFGARHGGDQALVANRSRRRLGDARIELAGVLAETTITIEELRNLEVGDVITSPSGPRRIPVVLTAERRAEVPGEPRSVQGEPAAEGGRERSGGMIGSGRGTEGRPA